MTQTSKSHHQRALLYRSASFIAAALSPSSAPRTGQKMADSTVIRISRSMETEVRELDRTPLRMTPTRASPLAQSKSTVVIDRTLSSAANLVKLLPSGTVLAFQSLSPSFANKGTCYTSNRYLTAALISVCVLTCIFFTFTDCIIGGDGKHYYGIATFKSFYVFNYDGTDEDRSKVFHDLGRFRIRLLDYIHAFFSLLVFLSLISSDSDVQTCFFPDASPDAKELLVNLPLGAGFISSLLFTIFPTSRKSIGYSDAMPHSQVSS